MVPKKQTSITIAEIRENIPGGDDADWRVVKSRTDKALESILFMKTEMEFIPTRDDFHYFVQAYIGRLPAFVLRAYCNDRASCLRYLISYARKRWRKRLTKAARERWKKHDAGEDQPGLHKQVRKASPPQASKRARTASPTPSSKRVKHCETSAGDTPTLPAVVPKVAQSYLRICQDDPIGVILGYYDDPVEPLAPGMDIDHFWEYEDCDRRGPPSNSPPDSTAPQSPIPETIAETKKFIPRTAQDRLQDMQEKGDLFTRFSHDLWQDFLRFCNRDPTSTYGQCSTDKFHLPGIRTPLFPYQAFGVYLILRYEGEDLTGGYLADEMGLGKTLIALATITTTRQVYLCKQDCALNPDKHHPPGYQGDDPCPQDPTRQDLICCPCVKNSPTESLRPSDGIQVIVAPKSLLEVWGAEWDKHVDPDDVDIQLLRGHYANPKGVAYAGDPNYWDQIRAPSADSAATALLTDHKAGEGGQVFRARKIARSNRLLGRPNQNRFVVIISSSPPTQGFGVLCYDKKPVVISRVIVDEAHKHVTADSGPYQRVLCRFRGAFRGHKLNPKGILQRPPIWFLTGTPFPTSPDSLIAPLSVIKRDEWDANPELGLQNMEQQLREWSKPFKAKATLKAHNAKLDTALAQFKEFLLKFHFIRRTHSTKMFGRHIMTTVQLDEVVIDCPIAEQFAARLVEEGTKIRREIEASNNTLSVSGYLQHRVCISFPYLWDHKKEIRNGPSLKKESYYTRDDHFLAERIQDIVATSSKWQELNKILCNLNTGEKIVILTFHVPTALIVFLAVKEFHAQLHPFLVYSGSPDRSEAPLWFQDCATGAEIEGKKFAPGALIGTIGTLGTGFTLTAASKIVLVEQAWLQSDEIQAYYRIRRLGQKAKKVTAYKLLAKNSPLEQGIEGRHMLRGTLNFDADGEQGPLAVNRTAGNPGKKPTSSGKRGAGSTAGTGQDGRKEVESLE